MTTTLNISEPIYKAINGALILFVPCGWDGKDLKRWKERKASNEARNKVYWIGATKKAKNGKKTVVRYYFEVFNEETKNKYNELTSFKYENFCTNVPDDLQKDFFTWVILPDGSKFYFEVGEIPNKNFLSFVQEIADAYHMTPPYNIANGFFFSSHI